MSQPSGSRIPPPGTMRKRQNENAPSDARDNKRQRTEPQKPTLSVLKKSVSASRLCGGVTRFSEAPKRGVLKTHTSAGNIRESLPAFQMVKSANVQPPPVSKPRKIPAWDLKGRIEQMEKINGKLHGELQTYNHRIIALEDDKNKLNVDVAIKSQQSEEATAAIQDLEAKLKSKNSTLEEITNKRNLLLKEKDEWNEEQERLQRKISQIEARRKSEVESLEAELSSHKSLVTQLTANHSAAQSQLDATKLLLTEVSLERDQLKKCVQEQEIKLQESESKIQEGEICRRQLHNAVQELKGNIRVFCRIRPPLQEELDTSLPMSTIHIKNHSKTFEISRSLDCPAEPHSKGNNAYEFTFDAIFNSSSRQDDVFIEISELVQSALDGYNVCIFAYGQTGSGKTYTMEGPANITNFLTCDESCLGMIPRSVQQIFSAAKKQEANGWKYRMEASFMEIYNESIRDLLASCTQNSNAKCQIKRTADKGSDGYISNVKHVPVSSASEVYSLLQKARANRVVATTNCNEHSSRSHYVFQMKLAGENEKTGINCEGILNLVDLAGSERIKESGSAGERLTEAKNINKSLSNLGNVIMALSQKAEHIPYRNSKLTHLLMNSLGGNSKTLMFVNINPCEQNFSETVSSLRFATKVNECNIGTAQKRIK